MSYSEKDGQVILSMWICHECGRIAEQCFKCCSGGVIDVPRDWVRVWNFYGEQRGYIPNEIRYGSDGEKTCVWREFIKRFKSQNQSNRLNAGNPHYTPYRTGEKER